MALFKIFKGSADSLGATGNVTASAKEGFCYFTQDDGRFYIDIADGENAIIGTNRIPIKVGTPALSFYTLKTYDPYSYSNLAIEVELDDKKTQVYVPGASNVTSGVVTILAQQFKGEKTFLDSTTFSSELIANAEVSLNDHTTLATSKNLYFGSQDYYINGDGVSQLKQLKLTANPGKWITGKFTIDNASIGITTQQTSSYSPYIHITTKNDHVFNFGGINDHVGFYGFYNTRTIDQNGADWKTYIDTSSGKLYHTNAAEISGIVTINNSTAATSGTSGALRVSGGAGINGALYVNGQSYFKNTNNATSATTGSVIIDGGLSVAKDIYNGGSITTNAVVIRGNQLKFESAAINYIVAPTSSKFAFVCNNTIGDSTIALLIDGSSLLPGYTSGVQDLGSENYKWNNVYANKVYGELENNLTIITKNVAGTTIDSVVYSNKESRTLSITAEDFFSTYGTTKSVTLTTEWTDLDVSEMALSTGSYILRVYVHDPVETGLYHEQEYYTGFLSWYDTTTMDTDWDEIILHKAGQASHENNLYLRTVRSYGGRLKLQVSCNKNCTTATQLQFLLRRII